MAGHKSAIGGIWFEMKAWMRFLLPSRYLAAYYPTPDHIVQRMLKVAEVTAADTVSWTAIRKTALFPYSFHPNQRQSLTAAAQRPDCRFMTSAAATGAC